MTTPDTNLDGMTTELTLVAQAAHEVNRAYCEIIGDGPIERWERLQEIERASLLSGVKEQFIAALSGRILTPVQQHERWLAYKRAEGWQRGPTKNVDLKLHPNLVPFRELPDAQRIKSYLFCAVVQMFIEVLILPPEARAIHRHVREAMMSSLQPDTPETPLVRGPLDDSIFGGLNLTGLRPGEHAGVEGPYGGFDRVDVPKRLGVLHEIVPSDDRPEQTHQRMTMIADLRAIAERTQAITKHDPEGDERDSRIVMDAIHEKALAERRKELQQAQQQNLEPRKNYVDDMRRSPDALAEKLRGGGELPPWNDNEPRVLTTPADKEIERAEVDHPGRDSAGGHDAPGDALPVPPVREAPLDPATERPGGSDRPERGSREG